MTNEEILKYNKRCAEFLYSNTKKGYESGEIYIGDRAFKENMLIFEHFHMMKFHSDWNWIMEVINQILKIYRTDFYLDFDMPVSDTFTVSIGSDGNYNSRGESNVSSKEAVVQAINEFLIWYNNEIQTNKQ